MRLQAYGISLSETAKGLLMEALHLSVKAAALQDYFST